MVSSGASDDQNCWPPALLAYYPHRKALVTIDLRHPLNGHQGLVREENQAPGTYHLQQTSSLNSRSGPALSNTSSRRSTEVGVDLTLLAHHLEKHADIHNSNGLLDEGSSLLLPDPCQKSRCCTGGGRLEMSSPRRTC